MNTPAYLGLIKKYDLLEVEKAMVLHYAELNGIDFACSDISSKYLDGFKPSNELREAVKSLGAYTIEDLSVAFEQLMPAGDRIINGAFFTPAYIVDYIIENIAPGNDETVADISCGCGAFLLGAIRYFSKNHNRNISEVIRKNIVGADIFDYNVRRAKVLICLHALKCGEVVSFDDINICCCDSLKYDWKHKFDCIVGNPPYVKFQDMDEGTREYLIKNWSTTSFGTFNLYFAFFEQGFNLLKEKGRLGYITPNNYFTSLAGESLRSYFQGLQCIYNIIDFSAVKVFDVQAYTAMTFINRDKNDYILYDRIKENQTPADFLKEISLSANSYLCLDKKKWRLLCGEEHINIKQIESVGRPIGELFNICVGIATLKDDLYSFIPSADDDSYYYFSRGDSHWKVEKEITRSTVKISDMKCQEDVVNNRRHFIFPYKLKNGKMEVVPEDEMKSQFPCCYEYLLSVRDVLANRGKGKHTYTPFYSYGRTQGLNRTGIKIYTPTFSKTPRFLVDKNTSSLFTNGYGIFLRENAGNLFDSHPLATVDNLDVIQKNLNSDVMNYYITATSVAIEGGYPCYLKNFIEKFTIPYLETFQIQEIRNITDKRELNDYLEKIYHIQLPRPNLCS